MDAFLLPAYLVVGAAIGAWGLWREERRPAVRMPLLGRLGVWIYYVGAAAVWWLPALALRGIARAWSWVRGGPIDELDPPLAPPPADADGVTVLGRSSMSGAWTTATVFGGGSAAMLFACWEQERELNGLIAFATPILFVTGLVPGVALLRQAWARRHGLRAEPRSDGEALLWTECPHWTRTPRRLPLAEIERAALWESDPIEFECGVGLALSKRAAGQGNVPLSYSPEIRRKAWPGLTAKFVDVPADRLILWTHLDWEWEPAAVAAWLASRGVTVDSVAAPPCSD